MTSNAAEQQGGAIALTNLPVSRPGSRMVSTRKLADAALFAGALGLVAQFGDFGRSMIPGNGPAPGIAGAILIAGGLIARSLMERNESPR
jgi:hypothetical protein